MKGLKKVWILILIFTFVLTSCGKKVEEKFHFPYLSPQKVFGGTNLTMVIKFNRNVSSVDVSPHPYNASFNLVDSITAVFSYNPSVTEAGVKDFTLTAKSGGTTVSATLQVTVLKPNLRVNYPPQVVAPKSVSVYEGEELQFYMAVTDPESGILQAHISSTNLPGNYTFNGFFFKYRAEYGTAGDYYIKFTASDGVNDSVFITTVHILKNFPSPNIYATSITYVIHEGEIFHIRFNYEEKGEKEVSLTNVIEGMSLSSDDEGVDFTFMPGMGYSGGETVSTSIVVVSGEKKYIFNMHFKIINEGDLLMDLPSSDFLLSDVIDHRYIFFFNTDSSGNGYFYDFDIYADYPLATSYPIENCQKFFFGSMVSGDDMVYSCSDGSNQIVRLLRVFNGETPDFESIEEKDVPHISLGNSEGFWGEEFSGFSFVPDYSEEVTTKILRESYFDNPFQLFGDGKWVGEPPENYSPQFENRNYGVRFIEDKEGRILLTAKTIAGWDYPLSTTVSQHLAILKIGVETPVTTAVEYVLPVTLPEEFVDADSLFTMAYWGMTTQDAGRFIIVDGSGYQGAVGYLTDNGVKFDSKLIQFYKKVKRIFAENNRCFLALFDDGVTLQRYCENEGKIEKIGGEIDVRGIIGGDGEVKFLRFENGSAFIGAKRGGNGELIRIPESYLE